MRIIRKGGGKKKDDDKDPKKQTIVELNDDDDDEDDTSSEDSKFHVITTPRKGTDYIIILSSSVDKTEDYYKLYELLVKATKHDRICFHLNSFGGYLHTGVNLIHEIRSSKAQVTMRVVAPVYSMASIIALCGDKLVVEPHSYFMFHDYSGIELGKSSEMHASVTAGKRFFNQLLKDICHPYLTKQEITNILKGQDLYIPGKDMQKRWNKINAS